MLELPTSHWALLFFSVALLRPLLVILVLSHSIPKITGAPGAAEEAAKRSTCVFMCVCKSLPSEGRGWAFYTVGVSEGQSGCRVEASGDGHAHEYRVLMREYA